MVQQLGSETSFYQIFSHPEVFMVEIVYVICNLNISGEEKKKQLKQNRQNVNNYETQVISMEAGDRQVAL